MTDQQGIFTISLDFELHWGMFDKLEIDDYRESLLGVRTVVPALLELFEEFGIHATWATVGFLFFEDTQQLSKGLPHIKPEYDNAKLCAYTHLSQVGANEIEDPYHYAPSLIKLIQSYRHQELGSHTFSHYYCLEPGQSSPAFRADLAAWNNVAYQYGQQAESICFARNQYAPDHLSACRAMGISAYRGTEPAWLYQARSGAEEHLLRRGLRLLDTYLPLTPHHCVSIDDIKQSYPYNIQSSRFLRAYSTKLKVLEPFKLKRILSGMTYAAKRGLVYHLWWHPQDFGPHPTKNLSQLRQMLTHFSKLQETYGMQSLNMGEIAQQLRQEDTAQPEFQAA